MWFDMSDPHRVTRRSANGFWLHVVAAPALVNTIALSACWSATAPGRNLILLAVLGFFALVAIVIDRRSFLIAAIGYSVALALTIWTATARPTTVLALGVGAARPRGLLGADPRAPAAAAAVPAPHLLPPSALIKGPP